MQNIIGKGNFHFEEKLIGFNLRDKFHRIRIEEFNCWHLFFPLIEENKLISFFIIFNVSNYQFFKFYFGLNVIINVCDIIKYNEFIMSSWNNKLFLGNCTKCKRIY